MKFAALTCLLTVTLVLIPARPASAQRESFDASVVRIIEADAIKTKLKPKPERTVERHGMTADGSLGAIAATESAITFEDVFFEFDSIKLGGKSSELQLQEILKALKSDELKARRFLIEGHTCDIGEADYNLRLSSARAQAIKAYLVKHGIPAERLATLGCGETDPAVKISPQSAPAEIETQRARNRRVVLRQLPASVAKKDRKK